MAGDVEHVVHASEDPEVAIVVALGTVTWKVEVRTTRPLREIRLHVPLVVVPDRAKHRGPWLGDGQETSAHGNLGAFGIQQRGRVSGKRASRAAGFSRRHSGQGRDRYGTRFR